MIEKFSAEKHQSQLKDLPFKYEASSVYLDFAGYIIERNGEKSLVVQDVLYPNNFPYLFLPKKRANWPHSLIVWASEGDLEKLRQEVKIEKSFSSGKEFYYQTRDFVDMSAANFRKEVEHFSRGNNYKLMNEYPREKVKDFIKEVWLEQQKKQTISFEESYNFFLFCLDNQEKYTIKTLYVEIDGRLAGLAMGAKFNDSSDMWIALHIKVDYKFRGLSRFLYHERAKLFANYTEFTSGATCAGDDGIEKFKNCLHPCRVEESYYVITGDRVDG